MKTFICKVFSYLRRLFLRLWMHVHIEVGVKQSDPEDMKESANDQSDDPDIKE